MPTLKGWCPEGHAIEAFVSSDDVCRDGEDGVIAVMSVEEVTCSTCGALIDSLASFKEVGGDA